jgi:hypothetical protein
LGLQKWVGPHSRGHSFLVYLFFPKTREINPHNDHTLHIQFSLLFASGCFLCYFHRALIYGWLLLALGRINPSVPIFSLKQKSSSFDIHTNLISILPNKFLFSVHKWQNVNVPFQWAIYFFVVFSFFFLYFV